MTDVFIRVSVFLCVCPPECLVCVTLCIAQEYLVDRALQGRDSGLFAMTFTRVTS